MNELPKSTKKGWQKMILGAMSLPFIAIGFVSCLISAGVFAGWKLGEDFIIK